MIREFSNYLWDREPEVEYYALTIFFNADLKGRRTYVEYFKLPEGKTYNINLLLTDKDELYGIEILYPNDLIHSENPVLPDIDVKIQDRTYKLFDVIKYICEQDPIDEE